MPVQPGLDRRARLKAMAATPAVLTLRSTSLRADSAVSLPAVAAKLIARAVDRGIRYFDAAPSGNHGVSEACPGEVLAPVLDGWQVHCVAKPAVLDGVLDSGRDGRERARCRHGARAPLPTAHAFLACRAAASERATNPDYSSRSRSEVVEMAADARRATEVLGMQL